MVAGTKSSGSTPPRATSAWPTQVTTETPCGGRADLAAATYARRAEALARSLPTTPRGTYTTFVRTDLAPSLPTHSTEEPRCPASERPRPVP